MSRSRKNRGAYVLVAFLLCVAVAAVHAVVDSEAFEEEDPWAVTDIPEKTPEVSEPQPPADSKDKKAQRPPSMSAVQIIRYAWGRATWKQFTYELLIISFCIVYIANIFVGRWKNAQLARAWGKTFCLPGGIFDRNFAQVGTGDGRARVPLLKESGSEFALYCSGRRHCKFLKATLDLKKRQDLLTLLLGLVFPWDDKVDIEVVMNEASMPQIVLAVATKKLMKQMLKEEVGEDDVRKLARKIEVSKERAASWPSDKLVVYAEHSSIFNDIISEPIIDQLFGKAAFGAHGRYFRQLHFTSEQSYGPKDQRAVLRFSFLLPPADRMEELSKLLSSVGAFIDIVAGFKLSPDLKKRAEKARQDLEKQGAKDKGRERLEALEERRLAKRVEEQEKLKRMTPEQREKYEQRKAKIENGRQQRKYVRKG